MIRNKFILQYGKERPILYYIFRVTALAYDIVSDKNIFKKFYPCKY